MNRNAVTYSPAFLSGVMVFAALAVAGITGCGDSSVKGTVYASHELNAGAPIYQVDYHSQNGCTSAAITLAPLAGKAVRDLEVASIPAVGGPERRYYALVSSPAVNGNMLLVIRGADQAVLASIPIQAQAQAMAISSQTNRAYIVRGGGGPVYRVNLDTNAVDLTVSPLNGGNPALQNPTDIAVRRNKNNQDEVWIGDGGVGGVVVLDQNLGYLGQVSLTGATFPRLAMSRDGKMLFASSLSPSTSLWGINATTFDTTNSAPTVQAVVTGLSNVEAIGAAQGLHAQVVSQNTQFELQDYNFANVNPASTKAVVATFSQRPSGLVYSTQSSGTFVSERNLGRVACQDGTGTAVTASTPVAVTELRDLALAATPAPVSVTIQTNPPNLPLEVDGQLYSSTQSFQMIPGSQHAIRAEAPAPAGGTRQQFTQWADGNTNAARAFTVPGASTTLTANFTTQHLLTLTVGANGTASASPLSPGGDGYYNAGTPVTITAVPNGGFSTTFTGTDTASGNTGSVTMSAPRTVGVTFASAAPGGPFTYSTTGVFLCTALPGCGTNTVTIGDVLLAFTGASGTAVAPTIVPGGAVIVGCLGGGTGCALTALPPGFGLQVTLNQTAPSVGSGNFTATVWGSVGGTASTGSMFFGPSQPMIPRPGGTVNYVVTNNPSALVPVSVNAGVSAMQLTVSFQ